MRAFLAALCFLSCLLSVCPPADAGLFSRPAADCPTCQAVAADSPLTAASLPVCDRPAANPATRPHVCPWNAPARPKTVEPNVITPAAPAPVPNCPCCPPPIVVAARPAEFPYGLLAGVCVATLLVGVPIVFLARVRASHPGSSS